VVFSCLKGAEDGDGLILRLFNPNPFATSATVRTTAAVSRVRLDEQAEIPLEADAVEFRPSEIVTLRLRPRSRPPRGAPTPRRAPAPAHRAERPARDRRRRGA
jgi:hypothetical protein